MKKLFFLLLCLGLVTSSFGQFYNSFQTEFSYFPKEIEPVKNWLKPIVNGMYYKDLQFSHSPYGDKQFESFNIINKRLEPIHIPGTQIQFILDNEGKTFKEKRVLPITNIEYTWPILAYVRSFNLDDFNYESPKAYYDLSLDILTMPDAQVVANCINTFASKSQNGGTTLNGFVDEVNQFYEVEMPYPESDNNPMVPLLKSIEDYIGKPAPDVVFEAFLHHKKEEEVHKKLNNFFRSLLPTDDIRLYVNEILSQTYKIEGTPLKLLFLEGSFKNIEIKGDLIFVCEREEITIELTKTGYRFKMKFEGEFEQKVFEKKKGYRRDTRDDPTELYIVFEKNRVKIWASSYEYEDVEMYDKKNKLKLD